MQRWPQDIYTGVAEELSWRFVGGSCENWEGKDSFKECHIRSDELTVFLWRRNPLSWNKQCNNSGTQFFCCWQEKKYCFFLNGCNVSTVAGGVFFHISGLRETTYKLLTVQALWFLQCFWNVIVWTISRCFRCKKFIWSFAWSLILLEGKKAIDQESSKLLFFVFYHFRIPILT